MYGAYINTAANGDASFADSFDSGTFSAWSANSTNGGDLSVRPAPAHAIEIDWRAATAIDAEDGSLTFWIDDVQKVSLTDTDNDTQRIDRIQRSIQGTYFFDDFKSSRRALIDPAGGVPADHQLFLPAVQQ